MAGPNKTSTIADTVVVRGPRSGPGAPVGMLGPQSWMHEPATLAVVAALSVEGAPVRFVGGCVRDALAGKRVRDVDLATPTPPGDVIRLLEAAGIKAVPTGIDHGTVTAVANGTPFEITTLRRDIGTDGRHATVAFTDSWAEDAARRDLTINALSANLAGDVFDYFDGISDLGKGRVRFVGRAMDRVEEDRLRLLRYFRFFAHYGRLPFNRDALAACRKFAPQLAQLSGERVRAEFLRLLEAPDPATTLNVMRAERVLEHLLPEAQGVGPLRKLVWLETSAIKVDQVTPDPVRRLAALLIGGLSVAAVDGAVAHGVAARLRLSNRERGRLVAMVAPGFAVSAELDDNAVRGLLYGHGAQTVRDVALIEWARKLDIAARLPGAETKRWTALLEALARWKPVKFPIGGRDAKALGLTAGPAMGELLGAVEDWWVTGGCRADRSACLAEMARRAK